jgi:hypothetical protein
MMRNACKCLVWKHHEKVLLVHLWVMVRYRPVRMDGNETRSPDMGCIHMIIISTNGEVLWLQQWWTFDLKYLDFLKTKMFHLFNRINVYLFLYQSRESHSSKLESLHLLLIRFSTPPSTATLSVVLCTPRLRGTRSSLKHWLRLSVNCSRNMLLWDPRVDYH